MLETICDTLVEAYRRNWITSCDGTVGFDIVGIKGHGVVAIDTSPWRAFEHIERLEHICQIVLASGKF